MADNSEIKSAEQAGLYLGAIAVIGRLNHFGITRIVRDDEHWPGSVLFKNPILPPYVTKFSKHGDARAVKCLERAIMTNIAGAMAVAICADEGDEERLAGDPQIAAMTKVLEEVEWWRSQAASHLTYLQHRVVQMLAISSNWRAVAKISQLLMVQHELTGAQLQQQIREAAKCRTVNGNEHFIVIEKDSQLPGPSAKATLLSPPPPPPRQRPKRKEMYDGAISRDLMLEAFNASNDRLYFELMSKRLNQTEPALMSGIVLMTVRALGMMKIPDNAPQAQAIREGITRCGVFVADVINRSHTEMWMKEYDSYAP